MKIKLFSITTFIMFIYSCSESNDSPTVNFENVIGCYNYNIRTENEYICINSDSLYFHSINDEYGNIIFSEIGKLLYNRVVKLNKLILLNFSHIENDTVIYKTNAYFYVCKKWGKITLSHSFNADPDGAPMIPKYKKVKEK